jgi:hypothetical protein
LRYQNGTSRSADRVRPAPGEIAQGHHPGAAFREQDGTLNAILGYERPIAGPVSVQVEQTPGRALAPQSAPLRLFVDAAKELAVRAAK